MSAELAVAPGNGLGALLRQDGFRRLATGQLVSGIGDWMVTLALMVLVLDVSDSSTAVGGVLVLRLLPTLVAGPIVARLVRRWDRRSTMLAMDAVRVVVVLAIPVVDTLWWIYAWAFVLELAGLIFVPARDAAVPDLASRDSLPLANGVMLAASFGTIPVGALCFGLVSWAAGGGAPAAVFAADAATFAVSYWFIARVRLVDGVDPADAGASGRFVDALRLPIVRAVGPAALVTALGLGTLFSMGVVFVQDVLGASTLQFGVLVALFGVGAAGGLAILAAARRADLQVVRLCVAAQGIVVAALSQAPSILAAFAGAVLFGAATAAGLAAAMSVLQAGLGERDRVLAFTAFHVVIRGGLGLAALGAGLAGDLLGRVEWPALGTLQPASAVLFVAGMIVAATALFIRLPSVDDSATRGE
jgi:predicted MFS family arabinose efflux permease